MLAGTIDTEGMPSTKAFIARYAPAFPVGESELMKFQSFGQWSPMMRTFVPFIFFIDRKGMIREQHMGTDQSFFASEAPNYRKTLDALLAEGGAPAKPATTASSTKQAAAKSPAAAVRK